MRTLRFLLIFLFFQTVAWVILMAISTAPINGDWNEADFVRWASENGPAYKLNYINVSLLTVLVTVLFTFMYLYVKGLAPGPALAGLVLVPLYGLLNLVIYSIQISVVPAMASHAIQYGADASLVAVWIQADPDSLAGYLNGLAYGILGIPSVIFGVLLLKKMHRYSGVLLSINGVFCFLGLVGYHTGSEMLEFGTVLGGIFFLLFLAAGSLEIRHTTASFG